MSNLFGRANHLKNLNHILFGDPHDRNGLRTRRRSNSASEKRIVRNDIASHRNLRIGKSLAPLRSARSRRVTIARTARTIARRLAMMRKSLIC